MTDLEKDVLPTDDEDCFRLRRLDAEFCVASVCLAYQHCHFDPGIRPILTRIIREMERSVRQPDVKATLLAMRRKGVI